MDTQSQTPPPPDRTQEWPTARAARGKFYGVNDPVHEGDQLCVMSMETWVDFGTLVKRQEQLLAMQSAKISEYQAANQALATQLADANERLNNLRTVRRNEKRHDVEKDLILPGNANFFNPQRKQ